MTDIETTVENARAQYHYPPIRSAILPSEADDLQMRLADRQRRHPHRHALEVIADLGRVFDAEDAEPAIEALGRLLVHASLLAGCERMAIAPIILLGRELTRDSQASNELPLRPAAMLAHAALDHRQEPSAIVRGLAMAIAKAIDDCEIVHELKVDPLELFKVAAREVLDGVAYPRTSQAIAGVQVVDKAAQRALAWTELRKAAEVVVENDQAGEDLAAAGLEIADGRLRKAVSAEAGGGLTGVESDIHDGPRALENIAPVVEDIMRDEIRLRMGGRSPVPEALVTDDLNVATTPEQRANVEHWFKTPHEVLMGKVTHAELDAVALAVTPPGQAFERRIVPDPGNPGGQGAFGEHPWPPDHRWETDAELRERINVWLHAPRCPICSAPMSACPDSPGAWHCPKHP